MHSSFTVIPYILFVFFSVGTVPLSYSQSTKKTVDITVNLQPLDPIEGTVFVQLIKADGEPYTGKTAKVRINRVQVTFQQVPVGSYAIRAFHDVNSNGELDRSWIGIPSEPYGFSNNVRGGMTGPPDLEEQLFDVSGNTVLNITLE